MAAPPPPLIAVPGLAAPGFAAAAPVFLAAAVGFFGPASAAGSGASTFAASGFAAIAFCFAFSSRGLTVCYIAGFKSLMPSVNAPAPTWHIVSTIASSAIVLIGPLLSVKQRMSGLIIAYKSHFEIDALLALIHFKLSDLSSGLPSPRYVHILLMMCSAPIDSFHLSAVAITSCLISAALSPRKASSGFKHLLLYVRISLPVASAIAPISKMTYFKTALFLSFCRFLR